MYVRTVEFWPAYINHKPQLDGRPRHLKTPRFHVWMDACSTSDCSKFAADDIGLGSRMLAHPVYSKVRFDKADAGAEYYGVRVAQETR